MAWLRPRNLVLVTVVLLLALAALLFWFGGPQRTVASTFEAAGTTEATSEPMPWDSASGPPPEGGTKMPLIPIPGCRCHSDDPEVVAEHAQYTLSECMECH